MYVGKKALLILNKVGIKCMNNIKTMITDEDKQRVLECLESGNLWRGNGKYLFELEEAFSNLHQSKYSLAVTNGTHALEIALAALDISFGDEVLIPAYTFIATASAVLMRNALPVPIEVDRETYCINPKSINEKITNHTKALIVVHIAGHACEMDEIMKIAKENSIAVIEDCAHAHGSFYKDKALGSIGDIGTFSFQAIKTMTAGEGGMIVTSSKKLYEKAYSYFNCGRNVFGNPYEHKSIASNYRMSEIQAALLIGQINRLENDITIRSNIVKYLNEKLKGLPGISPQGRKEYASIQGYSMYMFKFCEDTFNGYSKQLFIEKMNTAGFPVRTTYPVFYKTKMFENLYKNNKQFQFIQNKIDYSKFHYESSDLISSKVLWLPHTFLLSDQKTIDKFIDLIYQTYTDSKVSSSH